MTPVIADRRFSGSASIVEGSKIEDEPSLAIRACISAKFFLSS